MSASKPAHLPNLEDFAHKFELDLSLLLLMGGLPDVFRAKSSNGSDIP
jgi:hypothetical protein